MEHYNQYVIAVLLGLSLVGLLIYRQRRKRAAARAAFEPDYADTSEFDALT
jgi:hypothetical protein